MAQVITTHVYRMGTGNRWNTPQLEAIPVPFHALAVPVANQPAANGFVYSKIRFTYGQPTITEEIYSAETVSALAVKANT